MARRSRDIAVKVEIAIPRDSDGMTRMAYFLKTNVKENKKEAMTGTRK